MTLQDKINEIKNNPNYLVHLVEAIRVEKNVRSVFLEYWNTVGSKNEIVGYCKKFIILNYGKNNEVLYEDKATPNQVVRARKW